jgi:hypothetical protein
MAYFLYFTLYSQDIQVGIMGGMTLFQGDYPSYRFKDTFTILAKPGFGLFLVSPINDKLNIKGSIYFTTFSGDDRLKPPLTGIRTPSSINYPAVELLITGEYTPVEFNLFTRPSGLYLLGGFGFSKTSFKNNVVDDSCPIVNIVLPFGLGIRSRISDMIGMFLQVESVHALNDCLDGMKGFTSTKDVYSSLKVGLTYGIHSESNRQFGKNIGCPRF